MSAYAAVRTRRYHGAAAASPHLRVPLQRNLLPAATIPRRHLSHLLVPLPRSEYLTPIRREHFSNVMLPFDSISSARGLAVPLASDRQT